MAPKSGDLAHSVNICGDSPRSGPRLLKSELATLTEMKAQANSAPSKSFQQGEEVVQQVVSKAAIEILSNSKAKPHKKVRSETLLSGVNLTVAPLHNLPPVFVKFLLFLSVSSFK